MFEHLSAWAHAAALWAPQWTLFAPLLVVLALALIEAIVLPARLGAKGAWVLAVIGCGVLASAAAIWQQRIAAADTVISEELGGLRGLWTQLDALARTLPATAGGKPGASFDTVPDAIASLSAEVAGIGGRIDALRAQAKTRSVEGDTATKLADYLRQFGPHRVVVSCAPDDAEAYTYANQLANILRAAGWDALGPELSAGAGEVASIAVTLYVRDPRSPDAARILVGAFTRFNIPYQAGIASNDAIPDAATAELHVTKKP